MTGRTHDLAAFTALGIIIVTKTIPAMSLATVLVCIGANLIGGIAPDIDQPTAPFWRNLPIGHLLGKIFDKAMGGHRFLSHSLVGMAIFGFAWYYLLKVLHPSFPNLNMTFIWWSFMIGFFSHLIMDSFTKEGVPWLLPVPVKLGFPPLKTFRIKTGGIMETLIIFPGLFLVNGFLYYSHYSIFLRFLHDFIK
jgi:inner membrane protein